MGCTQVRENNHDKLHLKKQDLLEVSLPFQPVVQDADSDIKVTKVIFYDFTLSMVLW